MFSFKSTQCVPIRSQFEGCMVHFTAEHIGPVSSDLHATQTFTKYTEFSTQNQTYI